MSNIALTQKPIIEFSSIDMMAEEVDKRLSIYNFDQIVVDEDNYKAIKSLRAELNKELKEFEDIRKQIKNALLEPYNEFEKVYKTKIADKYSNAEQSLKKLIDVVENGLKQSKLDEVVAYFEELKSVHNLSFLTFDKANIKVGLTDTVKGLKNDVANFITSVNNDIELIKTQPNTDRVLAKYQVLVDVRQSIMQVIADIEREDEIAKQRNTVDVKITETKPIVVEPVIEEPEEILTVSFKVSGTKKQLVELRNYLKEKGIRYE